MAIIVSPIPSTGLDAWQDLISFRAPQALQTGINARFGTFLTSGRVIHRIEDAHGPISLDHYSVRVEQMPTDMDAPALLEHVRRNLNLFINSFPSGAVFEPYNDHPDGDLWAPLFLTTGFVGAVLSIKIITAPGIVVDRGSVLLADIAADHWTMSTMFTPQDFNHPVSGNRQWGFVPGPGGTANFYTRGADRCTTAIDDLAAEIVFGGADLLWRSLQQKFAAFVNANGGRATVIPPVAARYDWPQVQARYSHPTEPWL